MLGIAQRKISIRRGRVSSHRRPRKAFPTALKTIGDSIRIGQIGQPVSVGCHRDEVVKNNTTAATHRFPQIPHLRALIRTCPHQVLPANIRHYAVLRPFLNPPTRQGRCCRNALTFPKKNSPRRAKDTPRRALARLGERMKIGAIHCGKNTSKRKSPLGGLFTVFGTPRLPSASTTLRISRRAGLHPAHPRRF
jgi:hypothetical protein